jgi:DNA-binding CsgD family transcriptional regulator
MAASTSDQNSLVNAIYRTAAEPGLWPQTLTRIADSIGTLGGLLAYMAPPGESNNFLVVGRLRDDLTELYLQHYASNPISRALVNITPGQVIATSKLVDMTRLRRSAFHADILLPQSIIDQVAFTHASLTRNGSAGGMGFMLNARQLEDVDQAAMRLARLVPHLTRAIDLSLWAGRHQSGAWQLERTLDVMPGAALLLEGRGAVLHMNAAAEMLLNEADGLTLIQSDGVHLRAPASDEQSALARCIAAALSVARGEDCGLSGALRISRPSGRPALIVVATPLPPDSFSLWEAVEGGARALVQIIDPCAPVLAQADLLKQAVGLTPTEARVAALIGVGMSTTETAATLGISPNTVKTHLARCFEKAGVHSQAALARLLASMPAKYR